MAQPVQRHSQQSRFVKFQQKIGHHGFTALPCQHAIKCSPCGPPSGCTAARPGQTKGAPLVQISHGTCLHGRPLLALGATSLGLARAVDIASPPRAAALRVLRSSTYDTGSPVRYRSHGANRTVLTARAARGIWAIPVSHAEGCVVPGAETTLPIYDSKHPFMWSNEPTCPLSVTAGFLWPVKCHSSHACCSEQYRREPHSRSSMANRPPQPKVAHPKPWAPARLYKSWQQVS